MTTDRIRLVVLFGGRSAEHDVSCVSARHILAAADPAKYDIEPIGIDRDGTWVRADEAIAALQRGAAALPDSLQASGTAVDALPVLSDGGADDLPVVVFPIVHGPLGEDGSLQGMLELAGVPYVGSGVLASALAMDKIKAKELFDHHGIPQAAWRWCHADRMPEDFIEMCATELGLPVFVKPANMGSSVGVSKARTNDELREALAEAATYDEWLLVEENIDGREIEVSVLGNLDPIASAPGEIRTGADFYDYADKYLESQAEYDIPAQLPSGVSEELRQIAVRAYQSLRCEGLARVDFFYEEERGLLVNEVNTLPGFTPISMYPKMWEASGVGYAKLIDELVGLAQSRHARQRRRTDH